MAVQKIYPVQGSNKWESVAMPVTKAFRIDAGVQAAGAAACQAFNKGDTILSFVAIVTEAVTSAGEATVALGFTGTEALSAATEKATLVADYPLGPELGDNASAGPYILTADDNFDCTVATATLTAGKFDVYVTYIPSPLVDSLDSDYEEFVTA